LLTAIALSIGLTMQAAPVTFVRIAQTGDDPPGVTGPFTDFDTFCNGSPLQNLAPSVDVYGRVVFAGVDTVAPPCLSAAAGVFIGIGTGTLGTVKDRTDDPPGNVSTFANLAAPVIGPYGIVFYGRDSSFRSGIFTLFVSGPTSLAFKTVAATDRQVPETTAQFNGVSDPRIFNNLIAFDGDYPAGVGDQKGIFIGDTFKYAGSLLPPLFAVAMTGDDPPGVVGPFSRVPGPTSPVVIGSDGSAAFIGNDADFNYGIFQGTYDFSGPPNRIITTLISSGDPLPGSAGQFIFAQWLGSDGEQVAFSGIGTSGSGAYVYSTASASLQKIAESGEAAPGLIGAYANFEYVAVFGKLTAFTATDAAGNRGLFLNISGQTFDVLNNFRTLDGKLVSSICFGAQGLSGRHLAFAVLFADGSQGIYRADF
jgi:hypothetical protein